MAGIAAVSVVVSLVVIRLTSGLDSMWTPDVRAYRVFFPWLVAVYLLVVAHFLERTRGRVAQSLRPLLQIDDETFDATVSSACRSNPLAEILAAAVGVVFLISVVGLPGRSLEYGWLGIYYYAGILVVFAAMGWSVYAVVVISRLTNRLLRQPIEIDVFDVTPFEPIGMQSLYLSLAFIGVIVLSLPSSPYPLTSWQNIFMGSALVLVSVLIFFLNMAGTHRLLASAKKLELAAVDHKISRQYRQLLEHEQDRHDMQPAAAELIGWVAAKQELKLTRTWPYNTEMLRTLVVTVLIPIVVGLARIVGPLLSR